jgi:putative N6-adenine-specific DNA methylase
MNAREGKPQPSHRGKGAGCVGSFTARSFEELFTRGRLPLEVFSEKDAFRSWAVAQFPAPSVPTARLYQAAGVPAVWKRLRTELVEETGGSPAAVFDSEDQVTFCRIYLRTDCQAGYRKNSIEGPFKETLAAGILDLARIRPRHDFTTPCAVPAPSLIDGGKARVPDRSGNDAAPLPRALGQHSAELWQQVRQRALGLLPPRTATFKGYGFERSRCGRVRWKTPKGRVSGRIRVAAGFFRV